MSRIHWPFVAALSLMGIVPAVVWVLGMDARLAGALTGSAAAGLLMYRLISTYDETESVARAAIVLLVATLVLAAAGQYQLHASDHPTAYTIVTYPLIGHRVACILLGVYWPYILGAGRRSPLLKPR